LFGVSTSKDRPFYRALDEQDDGECSRSDYVLLCSPTNHDHESHRTHRYDHPFIIETPQTNGTALMKKVSLEDGDTVGVAVQQSDLPMIQFLVNGEPLHELAINRFRGTVYPSIYLAAGEGVKAAIVLEENDFRQEPPHVRFGPVIVAVSIV
jgi:hypothetical protein